MHIKFLARGTGSARAAADYLLGARDATGQLRAGVEVLRGDPHQVAAVADALAVEHKYMTSATPQPAVRSCPASTCRSSASCLGIGGMRPQRATPTSPTGTSSMRCSELERSLRRRRWDDTWGPSQARFREAIF